MTKLRPSVLARNVKVRSEFNGVSLTSQLVRDEIWWDVSKQGRSCQWPPPDGWDSSARNLIAGNNGVVAEHMTIKSLDKMMHQPTNPIEFTANINSWP